MVVPAPLVPYAAAGAEQVIVIRPVSVNTQNAYTTGKIHGKQLRVQAYKFKICLGYLVTSLLLLQLLCRNEARQSVTPVEVDCAGARASPPLLAAGATPAFLEISTI